MNLIGELFDPEAELFIAERFRPHWEQVGAIVFITFRTHDSIPEEVLFRWEREKNEWIHRRGFRGHWKDVLPTLNISEQEAFKEHFARCREVYLDEGHGRCPLRHPELAKIVVDALLHFDGQRYRMGDFVIMPNHVHLLAAFSNAVSMAKQCAAWLHFTARRIHEATGERGKFWQSEPFDHLVRSVEQYGYLRDYIADNPKKARLKPGEYAYRKYG